MAETTETRSHSEQQAADKCEFCGEGGAADCAVCRVFDEVDCMEGAA